MQIASNYFDDYSRTLRRVMWSDFIDRQVREQRRMQFRATLVGDPFERSTYSTMAVKASAVPQPAEVAATAASMAMC